MSKIEIILAGAGTGKTTRLAKVLQEALVSGDVRPQAVVATTFTRQAAAELAERARTRLLSAGRHQDAHQLQAARIGTVNSVCGGLVEQFAFELGLSPDVRVIDDDAAGRALEQALSSVATDEEALRLAELNRRMDDLEWKYAVARVVAIARANGVQADDLETSRARSVAQVSEVLGPKADAQETAAIDAALIAAMQQLTDTIPAASKGGAGKERDRCRRNLAAMQRDQPLSWREWASMAKLNATKAYATVANAVQEAAAGHERHARFHEDVLGAIDLVFTLAARTLEAYETHKRTRGVIDFVDQEAYALALLGIPAVAERLADEIDLVMVDEFQDTSPLQLAIFLKLAEIAPRSVWVGDQKQSIYGFRGTDPELMDAAIALLERRDPAFVDETLAALFQQSEPTTLSESWRSRPGLVELTSDVFVQAFAQHGMPEDRVRLRPGRTEEPAGLGPVVEVWDLQLANASHKTKHPLALAAGIDTLLTEGQTHVRDRATNLARPARLSDFAVLSRRKVTSRRAAEALESLGRRVVLPRPGLLATPEARLALAALRRWSDPRDRLSAAEIERMVRPPDEAPQWLRSLAVPDATADAHASVHAVDEARRATPHADPVTALQRAIDAVGLRTLCRRWGEARQRIGNLDALRSHAEAYVDAQSSEAATVSVAGLLAHFEQLVENKTDDRAVLGRDDAVTLSTWHAAKGLEWPITILFDLDWAPAQRVTGVEVESGRARLDLRDPLAGRWIRFVPQPFKANQTSAPFIVNIAAQPFARQTQARQDREQLRLLYVAWTRARDRLVLAGPAAKLYDKILASLAGPSGPLLTHPLSDTVTWAGHTFEVARRQFTPADPRPRSTAPGHLYPERTPKLHPPAWRSPSSIATPGTILHHHDIGPTFEVTHVDPRALGEAVHTFLAADDPTHSLDARQHFATQILTRWSVQHTASLPAHLVTAADALQSFIEARWPNAHLHREMPIWHVLPEGTVVRGNADLVVEHADGYAVIDHKAMLGSRERAVSESITYAGQLAAYGAAIAAAMGKKVDGLFVHLPLAGRVVELGLR